MPGVVCAGCVRADDARLAARYGTRESLMACASSKVAYTCAADIRKLA